MQINRILPKFRARLAKFLKQRPTPIVIPATTERDDRLNARATQKVLDYQWRKGKLEGKYRDALIWSSTTGKGFWWFYWDATKMARIKDPATGQPVSAQVGDICIEPGSPFELLVADAGTTHIGDQTEIMRVKLRQIDDVKQRYPDMAPYIKGDANYQEFFHYEKQISTLNSKGSMGSVESKIDRDGATHVVVKELFCRPGGKYPNGRYTVVGGDVMLK